jgi:hypothetical protein
MHKIDLLTIHKALLGDPNATEECTLANHALDCPVCGGDDPRIEQYIGEDGNFPFRWSGYCGCPDCYYTSTPADTQESALRNWNRRLDMRSIIREHIESNPLSIDDLAAFHALPVWVAPTDAVGSWDDRICYQLVNYDGWCLVDMHGNETSLDDVKSGKVLIYWRQQ